MRPILATFLLAGVACAWGRLLEPVDLGYGYDKNTIVYPGGRPYKVTKQSTAQTTAGTWYAANEFETAEHCGTHLDAPYHFDKNGRTVEQIPLNRLITTACLLDVSDEVKDNYNYSLPARKLEEWTEKNGEIPQNSVLFVKFGWGSRYPNKTEYIGPSDTDQRYPGLSEEAAQWIVNSKKVVGVGMDTLSLDTGANTIKLLPVHIKLATNDIYGLENVNLTAPLPPIFDIIVMPIKLVNGTGGPFVGVGVDTLSLDRPGNAKKPNHVTILGGDIYGLENVNLTANLPPRFDLIVMPIKLINGTGGPVRIIAH